MVSELSELVPSKGYRKEMRPKDPGMSHMSKLEEQFTQLRRNPELGGGSQGPWRVEWELGN